MMADLITSYLCVFMRNESESKEEENSQKVYSMDNKFIVAVYANEGIKWKTKSKQRTSNILFWL